MKGTVRPWSVLLIAVSLVLAGCGSDRATYSILPDTETFKQNTEVSTKIDILWVVDNSGSMKTSQENLAANFESFIGNFLEKNYDFQMAVTTTDAYLAGPDYNGGSHDWEWAQFRDGAGDNHSGVRVIRSNTPNLEDTFVTNILQGIKGYGDERHLSSMTMTLDNPLNDGFIREDGFLAVVFVTDEDDFSHSKTNFNESYDNPDLYPVEDFLTYLDEATNSTGSTRRYNVNTIAIQDEQCQADLRDAFAGRKIAKRVNKLAELTEGIQGDICGSFANALEDISSKIIEKANQFYLDREPIPETIKISVNGEVIPHVDENTSSIPGGWYYNPPANSIVFVGHEYIPPQGASIKVDFDPVGLDL